MSYHWGLGAESPSAADTGLAAGKECLEKVSGDANLTEAEFKKCAQAAAYSGAAAYCTAQAGPVAGELCGEAASYLAGKVAAPVYKTGRAIYKGVSEAAGDLFGGGSGCPTKLNGKCWPGAFTPEQQVDECLRLRKSDQAGSKLLGGRTGYQMLGCDGVLKSWDASYGAHVEATAKAADSAYRMMLEDFTKRYNDSVLPLQREVEAVGKRLGKKIDLGLMGTTPMNAGMAEVLGRDLVNYAIDKDRGRWCSGKTVLGRTMPGQCPVFTKADLVKLAGVDWFAPTVNATFASITLKGLGTGIEAAITSAHVVPKHVAWSANLNPSMFRMNPSSQNLVTLWARGIELANVELNAFLLDLVTQRAAALALWEGKWESQVDAERKIAERKSLGTMLLVLGGVVLAGGVGYLALRKS